MNGEQHKRNGSRSKATAFALLLLAALACSDVPEAELEVVEQPDLRLLDATTRRELEDAWTKVQTSPRVAPEAIGGSYGRLGQLFHALGRFDSAAACYRNAGKLQPNEPRWPYLGGQVALREGRLDEAAAAFERVLRIRPESVPAQIVLARVRREQGRADEARQLALAVAEQTGSPAPALFTLAQLAAERGDFEEAVASYRRVLELDPEASKLYVPLAVALRALGREEEAERELSRRGRGAVALDDPWMAEIQRLRPGELEQQEGRDAFARGDFEASVTSFAAALAARPGDATILLNLGASLFRAGRIDEARARYREALEADSSSPLVHFNLAVLLAAEGRPEAAAKEYRAALEIDPSHLGSRQNLAEILLRSGRSEEALAHFDELGRRYPGSAAARYGTIRSQARQGRWREAHDAAEASLRLLPDRKELRSALARLLACAPDPDLRDGERALALAEPLARDTGNSYHLETVAMALSELGRFEEAVALQARLVRIYREAGEAQQLPRLEKALLSYRKREACREPFPRVD